MTVGKDAVLVLGGGIYQIPLIERMTSKESSLPRAARMLQRSLPPVPMSRFVPSAPRSTP